MTVNGIAFRIMLADKQERRGGKSTRKIVKEERDRDRDRYREEARNL